MCTHLYMRVQAYTHMYMHAHVNTYAHDMYVLRVMLNLSLTCTIPTVCEYIVGSQFFISNVFIRGRLIPVLVLLLVLIPVIYIYQYK